MHTNIFLFSETLPTSAFDVIFTIIFTVSPSGASLSLTYLFQP
jgi:hypothetical protein